VVNDEPEPFVSCYLRLSSGDRSPAGYGGPVPYDQPGPRPVTAEQILAERFARGEIDEDEFWQRMTALRAGRPDDHSASAR
jgi:putative membrane protein